MKSPVLTAIRFLGFIGTLYAWWRLQSAHLPPATSLVIIIGSVLLIFPTVWIGRRSLGANPSGERLAWITTAVHMIIMILFGMSIIEAILYFQVERGIRIPFPVEIGSALFICTGFLMLLTVVNLALSGLGAPFAIALSKRIADRWMYRWTRNPMVLATLAALLAAGLYFQSLYFLLWAAFLVTPALIYYVKEYEERELEIRFGPSYLEYRARTPFLWPRRPTIHRGN